MSKVIRRNIPSMRLGIKQPELDEVLRDMGTVLQSGQLTLGSQGKSFEEEFASYVGVPFACALNSGTSALEIALRAFGVTGKQVLVPTNTFFATVAAVIHAGGIPKLVDSDTYTLNMDYKSLVKRCSPECTGVIVVHIGGAVVPCIEDVQKFCREKGMFLLEDAAHAHGSSLKGRSAGSLGDAATFSFYPTKVMTSGEGGMLVTRNENIYREAVIYRDQGKESFASNFHIRLGYNWRMSEIHAVLGRSQLKRLPANIVRRREIAQWYGSILKDIPELIPQRLTPDSLSNYYKYPVLLPKEFPRDEFKQRMKGEWGVSLSGEVYVLPCHKQPIFKDYADSSFAGADLGCAQHVCLPLYPDLTKEEVEYVGEALKAVVNSLKKEQSH